MGGRPVRDAGSDAFSAAIESIAARDTDREPASFARRIPCETELRGFFGADRRAVPGDRAPRIRSFADGHAPDAVRIVDVFRAKRQVLDVSRPPAGRRAIPRRSGAGPGATNSTGGASIPSSRSAARFAATASTTAGSGVPAESGSNSQNCRAPASNNQ